MKNKLLLPLVTVAQIALGQSTDHGSFDFKLDGQNNNVDIPVQLRSFATWEVINAFSDDFEYSNKNNSKFNSTWAEDYLPDPGFETGPGQTQWATPEHRNNFGDQQTVLVTNGKLELRSKNNKRNFGNSSNANSNLVFRGGERTVLCGIISSKAAVTPPVYMEAYVKTAAVRSSSNFWTLNKCDNQEVDMLENYGGDPDPFYAKQMSTNFHIWHRLGGQSHDGRSDTNCSGGVLTDFTYQTYFTPNGGDFNSNSTPFWRTSFHRFGVYWASKDQLFFFIDGVPRDNGSHFVSGRQQFNNLNGSFTQSVLECPQVDSQGNELPVCTAMGELGNGATLNPNRNFQGNNFSTNPLPPKEISDPQHIILDIEAHEGRPVETVSKLNNNNLNVMQVEWVRTYRIKNGNNSSKEIDVDAVVSIEPTLSPTIANKGEILTIDNLPLGSAITIFNTLGQKIIETQAEIDSSTAQITTEKLSSGIYFARIDNSKTIRFVIK